MENLLEIVGSGTVILIGSILIILGYLGSVLPVLPGVPLALISVWLVHLVGMYQFPWYVLAMVTVLAAGISLVDYLLPVWGTKKWGGTKAGVQGSTIGLIAGALLSFFSGGIGALGIIIGPFIGAYIGEKVAGSDNNLALKSATGSFLGFIAGTIGKFFAVTIIGFVFLYGVIKFIF